MCVCTVGLYTCLHGYECVCMWVCVRVCACLWRSEGDFWHVIFFYGFPSYVPPLSLILNSLYKSKMYIPVGYSSSFSLYLYFLVRYFYMFTLWQVHVYTKWNLGHFSHHYPLLSLISPAKTQTSPTFMTVPDFLWPNELTMIACMHMSWD